MSTQLQHGASQRPRESSGYFPLPVLVILPVRHHRRELGFGGSAPFYRPSGLVNHPNRLKLKWAAVLRGSLRIVVSDFRQTGQALVILQLRQQGDDCQQSRAELPEAVYNEVWTVGLD